MQMLKDILAPLSGRPVRVVVTDSGLGGLSVAANLAEKLRQQKPFQQAEITYFNAQPHLSTGYNAQRYDWQKAAIFQNALQALHRNLQPDVLLIACNTLSIIYDQTGFSKSPPFPVAGIVQTAGNLLLSAVKTHPGIPVVILATPTTIDQGTYQTLLRKNRVPEQLIVAQACPGLESAIERGPVSRQTEGLIHRYVAEARGKISGQSGDILVSYNCTHYPYAHSLIVQAFIDAGLRVRSTINPNPDMAEMLLKQAPSQRHDSMTLNFRLISQAEIPAEKIDTVGRIIHTISSDAARALEKYEHVPDFFEWASIAASDQVP